MKTLIYIGNQSGVSKHANVSSIDVLGPLLVKSGFRVFTASSKPNIIIRLLDMLWHCLKHRKKADYVIIDTYSTLNFYYAYFGAQWCRILNLKYIPILHGGNLPERLKSSPKLAKAIFNNAFLNVAPSLFIKSKFENLNYSNIICIPNSIELKDYQLKKRDFKSINLLWVRSFSKLYNPLLAIKILKALKDEKLKATLCMVGPDSDGSLLEAKNYANQLGVEVSFTGKLTKKVWIKRSEDYNIFINTTNFDNMPVSVIEAMALGLLVVSTNVGGLPFLIENHKNGVLVEPNSVNGFVESILNIIRTPDFAKQITENARNRVEKLDWEIVKKQWIKVLK